ncbi:uncharacterized protein LOC133929351 [Phragmites australis]|uniref:uncharacterized protein LOC133929351 n=1 Tax=Phragmites australis TaxID=29695 RepID=UPI002D773755|nr:uncharacterized protein LOC133929351 [Phragmites australis]
MHAPRLQDRQTIQLSIHPLLPSPLCVRRISSPSSLCPMPSPLPCLTSSAARLLLLPSSQLAAALARYSFEKEEFSTATAASGTAMAGSQGEASQPPAAGVAERIMPHLLNMYGSRATARDFEIYAPNATYDDPLMRAHGVKQIKSAFYTLPKVFGESKIVEYTIQENPTGTGKTEVLIDNKQHYKVFGKPVDLASLIRLEVVDGKVVKHEDWWDKKPLKSKETVGFPLLGHMAQASRRGAMLLTHALMGFGKDSSSS